MRSVLRFSIRFLPAVVLATACGDSNNDSPPDAGGCDPATVLPSTFRLIGKTSTGTVSVTTNAGVTSGKIDATAGGFAMSGDNPYVYVDLKAGAKLAITDLDARTSSAWDIALKRASVRSNSGDSGAGDRELAVVQATTLAEVTAAPASGYVADDFTTDDCMLDSVGAGEPKTAFGEWYDYDVNLNRLTPKPEVYVIKRSDGTSTAFRITAYYDPPESSNSAIYSVEWKQL